jgi:hypothetical protein
MIAAGTFAIRALADWWLRAKQLERTAQPSDRMLSSLEARLARIEHVVAATAVEVERIAEAQRFATKLLAEQKPSEALLPRGQGAAGEQD